MIGGKGDAVMGAAIEPGLLRRARPDGYWWLVFRRRPVATTGMVVLPMVAAVVLIGLVDAVLPWDVSEGAALVVVYFAFRSLRDRVRKKADADDEAEGVDLGRWPVDVRASVPVQPSFGPGSVTAQHVRRNAVATLLLVGGVGVIVLAVAIVEAPTHPNAVAVGIGAALVAAAPILVAAVRVRLRGRTTAFLARSLEPTPVRVLGMTTDGLHWVVEPVDGGRRSYLALHAGDDLLVAGDVVHGWGDVHPDPTVGTALRRVALTGPFGTLWAAVVRDLRDPRVRMPGNAGPNGPNRSRLPS